MSEDFRTYTNTSNNYQLVGNSETLVFEGSKEECIKELSTINISDSIFSVLKVLAPGETHEGHYSKPIEIIKETIDFITQSRKDIFGE